VSIFTYVYTSAYARVCIVRILHSFSPVCMPTNTYIHTYIRKLMYVYVYTHMS